MDEISKKNAGGLRSVALHGNPGTKEGRALGGTRSLITHQKLKTRFKRLIPVRMPKKSAKLAELLGIMMGDGHLEKYQMSVTTNSETDREHAKFVKELLDSTFNLSSTITQIKSCNAVIVLLSSKNACLHLHTLGMPFGNKLANDLKPPQWILKNQPFKKAFLRGLIDTDGCVYSDRHLVKGKQYSSTCIAFTSASAGLLNFVKDTWSEFGYSPTVSGRDVRLRRRKDVLEYAKTIGFSNPKHANKIKV